MIQLQMRGMAGNNLFQYAFARILAEDLGYALTVRHSPHSPEKNVPQLEELLSSFRHAPLCLPGKSFDHPVDRTAVIGHEGFDGFRIDLDAMLERRQDRKILVDGYFERYEIFRSHKERIRSWFAVDPIDRGHNISDDDVVLHIRRGDFVLLGRAISLGFYLDLLDKLDFRRLYICGFGIDREVKRSFRRYDPIYVHGTPLEDLRFMKGFNRIIQSQSTFAWWAGFLSAAEEIHAPITIPDSAEFERTYPHIDLRVDDEDRYHYVVDVPHCERPYSLGDLARSRPQLTRREAVSFLESWLEKRLSANRLGSSLIWAKSMGRWSSYRRKKYRGDLYKKYAASDRRVLGKYAKILVVRINHSYAGFFTYLTFALNQILFCERNHCLPVVYFGKWSADGENAYYDEAHGDNMWDYYFEPVAGHGYSEIQDWVRDPRHPVQDGDVVTLSNRHLWYLHYFEKRSVFAYPYGRYSFKKGIDAGWYQRQRGRAHEVIRRRVRVKKHIREKVDEFHEEHMRGRHVLGIHLRGTDKGPAAVTSGNASEKVGAERYFREIDRYLEHHAAARLFVATDQVQYLNAIADRYGDRVIANDCLRSANQIATFRMKTESGYEKGAEVLMDALLLARCDFLLKSSSRVGEAALWFNPDVPCLDLDYAS